MRKVNLRALELKRYMVDGARAVDGSCHAGDTMLNRFVSLVGQNVKRPTKEEAPMTDALRHEAERRLARGVVAGTAAGLLFLLANMWYADSQGMPAVAPLYDISTVFHFADKPDPSPENAVIGLVTHLTLAAGFGVLFALLAQVIRGRAQALVVGPAFGLLLYVVNFQILGRLFFEWFQEGPNQLFEVIAHAGFGLILAPFVLDFVRPSEAGAERSVTGARAGHPVRT
jgi:type IV secretory pathway TrbD component